MIESSTLATAGSRSAILCFLISTLLYLGVVAFSIDKPLTMDQAMPTAWNASEIHQRGFTALGQGRHEISHTLLHQHLLAATFSVFGETTRSARGFGVPCFLLTLLLLNMLARGLYPGAHGRRVGCVAMLLYASNPFVAQYSLLVDQETTLVPVTLLLFLIGVVTCRGRYGTFAIVKLSLLLVVGVWAKELPPYIALFALAVFLSLERGLAGACRVVVAVGLLGTAVFVASWALYCGATGVPVLSFVEFSLIGKALNSSFHGSSPLEAVRTLVHHTGRWVTPALLTALAIALLRRVRHASRAAYRMESADLLWIFVIVYWTLTNLHLFEHPRYQVPLYGAAVILVAELLVAGVPRERVRDAMIATLIGVGVGIASIWIVDDPLLMKLGPYLAFAVVVPLAVCGLAVAASGLRPWSRSGATLFLLAVLVAQATLLGVKQRRPYTTAVSWSEYGERGFDDALAYVRSHVGDSRPVLRKDLGFYLMRDDRSWRGRWIYNNVLRGLKDESRATAAAEVLSQDDVSIVVLDRYCNSPVVRSLLAEQYSEVEVFGDFRIYRRSPPTRAESPPGS